MSTYRFNVRVTPVLVHITGSGTNCEADLRRFLADATQAAAACSRDAVLLELDFSGDSLNFGGLYSVVCERIPDATRFRRIAFVDMNPGHQFDRAEFVELTANKLGANVRRFASVNEAEQWLAAAVDRASAR